MSNNLPSTLGNFNGFIDTLKPEIGTFGGRYFYCPQNKITYYCLNQLVQILENLDNKTQNKHDLKDYVDKIEKLDLKGSEELAVATKDLNLSSLIKRIGTWIKQSLGNYSYDRKAVLDKFKKRVIKPISTNYSSTANANNSTYPLPQHLSGTNTTHIPTSTNHQTTNKNNFNQNFTQPSAFIPPTTSSPLFQQSPQITTNNPFPPSPNFPFPNQQNSTQPFTFASSTNSTPFFQPSPQTTNVDILKLSQLDTSKSLPAFDWSKIDLSQQDPTILLNMIHTHLLGLSNSWLISLGFVTNEHGIPVGLSVQSVAQVSQKKLDIRKSLKQNSKWVHAWFTLLSRAGMGGYADQVRTSWAGLVDRKAKKIQGSIPYDKYPTNSNAKVEPHEDEWTHAIREGHKHYRDMFVAKIDQFRLKHLMSSCTINNFDSWDLNLISKNPSLKATLYQDLKKHKGALDLNNKATPQDYDQVLKVWTYLSPNESYQIKCEIQKKFPNHNNFEKVWKEQFDKQLESLGIKNSYYQGRQEAEVMLTNLYLIYESFGAHKIHPKSIETFLAPVDNIASEIQNLQAQGIIDKNPDMNGFYTVLIPTPYLKNDDQSKEGRIQHLLHISQGKIENRYVARRFAPTFYQSQTGNDNFDIPKHKLPVLLKYQDLREWVVNNGRKQLLNFVGMKSETDKPTSPKINEWEFTISVFIDSLVSMGDIEWTKKFVAHLSQNKITNSYWSDKGDIDKQFKQSVAQIEIPSTQSTPLPISKAQEEEYQNRRDHLLNLFSDGKLLVRVIELPELNDKDTGIYTGNWKLQFGPNLSTTLIPRKGNPIEMNLFMDGVRGVLLSPKTVVEKTYLGNGFEHNAVTQQNNFKTQLKKRPDGMAVDKVCQSLDTEGDQVELGSKPAKRDHTEIAYFRPAERNLVQGLFFKVNDEHFAKSLRELVGLQKEVLDQYGFFLPIFAYKDRQFQEVVVDEQLIKALGLQSEKAAVRTLNDSELKRKKENPKEFFNIYGMLDTQTVLRGKEVLNLLPPPQNDLEREHQTNFKKLFDLQLMILQLKSPKEKISFTMKTSFKLDEFISREFNDYQGDKKDLEKALKGCTNSDELTQTILATTKQYQQTDIENKIQSYQLFTQTERPVDLSIIDNLHLIFPTILQTGNKSAEAQNLFFSHSTFVRFLRANPEYRNCWTQMTLRNMEVFLGIKLKVDQQGNVTQVTFDKQFVGYFKDGTDLTGKVQYAKCISRLTQLLHLLDKKSWAQAIHIKCRSELGSDFGKNANIDFFTSSDEIKKTELYITNLSNPNHQDISKLPEAHGQSSDSFEIVQQVSRRFIQDPLPSQKPQQNNNHRSRFATTDDNTPPIDLNASTQILGSVFQKVWGTSPQPSNLMKQQGLDVNKMSYQLMGSNAPELAKEGAFDETKNNIHSVRVFYRQDMLGTAQIVDLVVKTALRTTNGDKDLLLPNGNKSIHQGNKSLLLTDYERRVKRYTMVKAGKITVTAKGGYNSTRVPLDKKLPVYVISTAAPQFEKYGMGSDELEVADFIVKKGASANNKPLFKEYYSNGTIPSHQELSKKWMTIEDRITLDKIHGKQIVKNEEILDQESLLALNSDVVRLRNGDFFLNKAFQKSMELYFEKLVLPAMNQTVQDKKKPIYLKATALGAGFFASLGLDKQFVTSLKKYVINALIKAYVELINNNKFDKGTVIEFPFYGLDSVPQQLINSAASKGIQIVWQDNRDLLDFSSVTSVDGATIDPLQYERVVLNAGDAFSFDGNEAKSTSVESMLANNSDLRQVFNWWFNPEILKSTNHVGV